MSTIGVTKKKKLHFFMKIKIFKKFFENYFIFGFFFELFNFFIRAYQFLEIISYNFLLKIHKNF